MINRESHEYFVFFKLFQAAKISGFWIYRDITVTQLRNEGWLMIGSRAILHKATPMY